MKRRRWVIVGIALVAVLAVVRLGVARMPAHTGPGAGDWVSTVPYRGTAPGAVGVLIRADGRVQVTGAPSPEMWWAAGGHELWLRGDRVDVRSGGRVVSELRVRHRAGELRLLDPAFTQEVLAFRKLDPAGR